MNLSIKLNLQNMGGAFLANLQGKTCKKQCLCIPVEDAHLVVGAKGTYADFSAVEISEEKRKFDDTHIVRQSYPKEVYQAMTEEERKAIPVIGGLKPMPTSRQEVTTVMQIEDSDNGDLPF